VTLAQLRVTKITTGRKAGPFMVVGQFPKGRPHVRLYTTTFRLQCRLVV